MDVREFIAQRDRLGILLGVEVEEVRAGYARASMVVRQEHLNGVGVGHGGAIFSLADVAFAGAANSHGTVAVAVNVNISFLKGVRLGSVLTAEAREASEPKRLGQYVVEVRDETGELVSLFQGMVYRKRETLEEVVGAEEEERTAD